MAASPHTVVSRSDRVHRVSTNRLERTVVLWSGIQESNLLSHPPQGCIFPPDSFLKCGFIVPTPLPYCAAHVRLGTRDARCACGTGRHST